MKTWDNIKGLAEARHESPTKPLNKSGLPTSITVLGFSGETRDACKLLGSVAPLILYARNVMTLGDLENPPDRMLVENIVAHALEAPSRHQSVDSCLKKLDILGERQWRFYEQPYPDIQSNQRTWSIRNLDSHSTEYLESRLGHAYEFALERELLRNALEGYKGKRLEEFRMRLAESPGDSIDPGWPVKRIGAKQAHGAQRMTRREHE